VFGEKWEHATDHYRTDVAMDHLLVQVSNGRSCRSSRCKRNALDQIPAVKQKQPIIIASALAAPRSLPKLKIQEAPMGDALIFNMRE